MSDANFGLVMVAGGAGTRMGGDTPKPFIQLEGREVLLRSFDAFAGFEWIAERILVLPKSIIRELFGPEKQRNFPSLDHENAFVRELAKVGVNECVCGGDRRQDSVLRGLNTLSDACELVMIHDAVRPFVRGEDIQALQKEIGQGKAATLATPVTDSLRTSDGAESVDRNSLIAVQTPQGGPKAAIQRVLESQSERSFSDDYSAFAESGTPLALVIGAKTNIKLTTPDDLRLAAFLLKEECDRGNA